jgi:hypothetical protein
MHVSTDPSPSALFARRLMHHCSAEALQAEASSSRRRGVSPSRSKSPHRHPGSTVHHAAWPWKTEIDELHEELEDSLEDLEDGLDVLMILERAYETTLKAHVIPEPPCPPTKAAFPTVHPTYTRTLPSKDNSPHDRLLNSARRSPSTLFQHASSRLATPPIHLPESSRHCIAQRNS